MAGQNHQFPLILPQSRKEVVKELLTTELGGRMNTLNINIEYRGDPKWRTRGRLRSLSLCNSGFKQSISVSQ